jgi:hypothetical protein
MDFGRFGAFWLWLAANRLDAPEGLPLDEILTRALGKWRTCVVCNLLWERTFYLTSSWQQELMEDPGVGAEFIAHQTWCNRHAWLFKEMSSPRMRSQLFTRLYARLQAGVHDALKEGPARLAGRAADSILRQFVGERTCPLCEDETEFESVLLADLAQGLKLRSFRAAYAASPGGCCLHHLVALVSELHAPATIEALLETTAEQLQRLTADLVTYDAETESCRRQYGAAADAPARAMAHWVGLKGMVRG